MNENGLLVHVSEADTNIVTSNTSLTIKGHPYILC